MPAARSRILWTIAVVLSLAAAGGRAQSPTVLEPHSLRPIQPEDMVFQTSSRDLGSGAPVRGAVDSLVYDNSSVLEFYFTPLLGFEVADDVHMVAGGRLNRFTIAYREDVEPRLSMIILFYENTPANNNIGRVLAGPYLVRNLPPGNNMLTLQPPDRPFLTKDVWWATAYSSNTAGPFLAHPPAVGGSDNLYLDVDRQEIRDFGQQAPANFFLKVYLDELETAVAPTTWSQVKALYRDDDASEPDATERMR